MDLLLTTFQLGLMLRMRIRLFPRLYSDGVFSNVQDIDIEIVFSANLLKEDVSFDSPSFSKISFGFITPQRSVNDSSLS